MAKFRPADTSPRNKGRHNKRIQSPRVPFPGDIRQDPWILPIGLRRVDANTCTAKSTPPVEAAPKGLSEKADVVVQSIGTAVPVSHSRPLGKIISADGKERPYYQEIPCYIYQPIAGFEHCFTPQSPPSFEEQITAPNESASIQLQASNGNQPVSRVALREGSPLHRKVAAPQPPMQGRLKRRRVEATTGTDSSSDSDQSGKAVRVKLEPPTTFNIGNFEEVKEFLLRQFRDLTLKIVRAIVTSWIKHREPKRRQKYGKYHKKLPAEVLPGRTPPWWPEDVQVNEPSHLCREHVLKLAVDFLLIHREIDQKKREEPWITILRQKADATLELLGTKFSSSKSLTYEKEMRERATEHILPSIFEVARKYENHVLQHSLFEESNHTDYKQGVQHTWQPTPKPIRRTDPRKRTRCVQVEDDVQALGEDTEVDDTATNAFLPRKCVKLRKEISPQAVASFPRAITLEVTSTPEPRSSTILELRQSPSATSVLPETRHSPPVSCAQPKPKQPHPLAAVSFNNPMDYLDFGNDMDLDTKGGSFHAHDDQDFEVKGGGNLMLSDNRNMLHSMYPIGQPLQYSSSYPGFDRQSFSSQDNMVSFKQSFGVPSTPDFIDPCQTLSTHFPLQAFPPVSRPSSVPTSTTSFAQAFHLPPYSDTDDESFNGLPFSMDFNA